MPSVLVLGYGNPLCRDDGIGWRAAQALSESPGRDEVQIISCQQLTPELAETISRFDRVIFIDASVEDEPGRITCHAITSQAKSNSALAHHLIPPALLAWSRELYEAEPQTVLVTMGAGSVDYGESFSPAVSKSFPALLDCVRSLIDGNQESWDIKH